MASSLERLGSGRCGISCLRAKHLSPLSSQYRTWAVQTGGTWFTQVPQMLLPGDVSDPIPES
jgi:hypothetical protein